MIATDVLDRAATLLYSGLLSDACDRLGITVTRGASRASAGLGRGHPVRQRTPHPRSGDGLAADVTVRASDRGAGCAAVGTTWWWRPSATTPAVGCGASCSRPRPGHGVLGAPSSTATSGTPTRWHRCASRCSTAASAPKTHWVASRSCRTCSRSIVGGVEVPDRRPGVRRRRWGGGRARGAGSRRPACRIREARHRGHDARRAAGWGPAQGRVRASPRAVAPDAGYWLCCGRNPSSAPRREPSTRVIIAALARSGSRAMTASRTSRWSGRLNARKSGHAQVSRMVARSPA